MKFNRAGVCTFYEILSVNKKTGEWEYWEDLQESLKQARETFQESYSDAPSRGNNWEFRIVEVMFKKVTTKKKAKK